MADVVIRVGRRVTGVLLTAALTVAMGVAPVGAQGEAPPEKATLTGTVVNGTQGTPAGNVEVTLHILQGDAELTTTSAKTDADGRYTFPKLETSAGRTYAVTAEYQAVTYESEVATLAAGETKELQLSIYDASDLKDNVTIKDWIIWIDREDGGAAVQHDLTLANAGNTAYVGDEELQGGKRAVVRLPIPEGARDFQYMGQFMECCAVVSSTTFIHTAAVRPGEVGATVRTSTDSLSQLNLTVPLPTATLRVFVPSDIDVTPSGSLKPAGEIEDMGVTYQTFTATNLTPGDEAVLEISGLASPDGSRTFLVWLLAPLPVLGAGIFVALRRLRKGSVRAKAPAPRGTPTPARAPAGAPAGSVDPLDPLVQAEADLIIEEIAALDLAYERGAMAEETHRRVRDARMARLLELRGVSEVSTQ